jgi:hypothetical protein
MPSLALRDAVRATEISEAADLMTDSDDEGTEFEIADRGNEDIDTGRGRGGGRGAGTGRGRGRGHSNIQGSNTHTRGRPSKRARNETVAQHLDAASAPAAAQQNEGTSSQAARALPPGPVFTPEQRAYGLIS